MSGMERRNFVPALEFDAELGEQKRPLSDEHRWTQKRAQCFQKELMMGIWTLLLCETRMLRMFWPIVDHNPGRNPVLSKEKKEMKKKKNKKKKKKKQKKKKKNSLILGHPNSNLLTNSISRQCFC
jgi:hypothetical protein